MTNTSATGGFLRLSPAQGQHQLEDVLHEMFTGITGFAGELVRPRWQPDPPEVPEPDVNWCAFGITQFDPANFPEIRHHGDGDGHDELVDYEELQVLVSFYGPLHMVNARALRRGLHVPQNRALLRPAGLAFVRAGSITPVPEMVAFGWRARADVPLTFRLETRSTFASLNLLKSSGCIRAASETTQGGKGVIEVPTGCQACPHACWRE